MSVKTPVVLLVLRGRPGLGHVIPGLALARAAYDLGAEIYIATYSNGYIFLNTNEDIGFKYQLIRLEVKEEYIDWPGLCPYDNGVREIMPLCERINANICIYGGEYILGPILQSTSCKTVSLFNPEILIENDRNRAPSAYLCRLLACSDFLVPLQKLPALKLIAESDLIRKKLISYGPFTLPPVFNQSLDREILIANGGGIQFPSSTASYSSSGASPSVWLAETFNYTKSAIIACLDVLGKAGHIHVFSCLPESDNNKLQKLGDENNLTVEFVSPRYYKYLHSADLVISRSGVGFLADVNNVKGAKIVWALSGHDEQRDNAVNFVKTHNHSYYCRDPSELHQLVKHSMALNSEPSILQPNAADDRARITMREILSVAGFLQ